MVMSTHNHTWSARVVDSFEESDSYTDETVYTK